MNLTLPVLEKWSRHKPLQTCHRRIISVKEQAPLLLNEHILQWCGRGQQQGMGVDPTNCKRRAPWAAVLPDKRVLPMCYRKQVVVQLRPFPDEAHDAFSLWARWMSFRSRCRADLFELGVQSLPDGSLHEQPFGLQFALSNRAIRGTLSEAIAATNSRHGTRHTGPPSNCSVPFRQCVSQSHDACYFPHRRYRRCGTPSSYDSRLCVFASNSLAGCPMAARPRIYREIWRRRRGGHLRVVGRRGVGLMHLSSSIETSLAKVHNRAAVLVQQKGPARRLRQNRKSPQMLRLLPKSC